MTVELDRREDTAIFRYPSGYDQIVSELNDLLDRRDTGELTDAGYMSGLEDLVARNPWFIDGRAHLGSALYRQGKTESALEACMRGYSLGTELLTPDMQELVEWRHLENRPFLRAAHCAALCHLRLGGREEAISVMERILLWNPDDNQGIRYLIGSEYLRTGQEGRAETFFETEAPGYPPYWYEKALLFLRQDRHVAAATSLRRGFVENGYIAEILCGNPDPRPIGIWHGWAFAEPELAKEYAESYGGLWHETAHAISFLRWLHMHPLIMLERAAILELSERLLWELDAERRESISRMQDEALAQIDNELSEEVVADRSDRRGSTVSPWLFS